MLDKPLQNSTPLLVTAVFMKTKFLYILLAILCCGLSFSCKDDRNFKVTYPIRDVPLDSVSSDVWFPDLMAVNTRSIIGLPSSKLCLVGPDDYTLTYFIDEEFGKELGYAGMVGEGPEDMQPFPMYAGKSESGDTIYLYDFNAKRMNAYRLTETTEGKPKMKIVSSTKLPNPLMGRYISSYMGICRLNNGFYVGLNFLSITDCFLTLLDRDLNVVKEFGEQPIKGLRNDGKIKSYQSFDGTLSAHGNSVYYASSKMGYMVRYDINENGEVTHKWTHRYTDIHYRIDQNQKIKYKSDNLYGFSDMTIGKNYIFTTYSGIPIRKMFEERNTYAIGAKTLVVFNHDGKPLGRFKLRSSSFCVGLSSDEKYIYVMNIDPEVQIERIKMSDIVEKIKNN